MYVGDTSGSGVHHLLWEVVGNTVDQHLARNATELHVDVSRDGWVSVRDDGPGLPVHFMPKHQKSAVEVIFTTLMSSGPARHSQAPHVHVTPNVRGVGLSVVNALSERTEVETTRDGQRWAIAFERGETVSPLRSLGPTSIEGTLIRFRPDAQIFSSIEIDLEHVRDHLQQLAWLSPLLRVFLQERRMKSRGGVRGWAEQLSGGKPDASFSIEAKVDDVYLDLALAWRGEAGPQIHSFVNMQGSRSHGTHVTGLDRAFAAVAKELDVEPSAFRQRIDRGLIAIVHVGLYHPRWGNPCKDQLKSPEAAKVVEAVLRDQLVAKQHLRAFFASRLA